VKRRVKRALWEVELAAAPLLDRLRDDVTVSRLPSERREDQGVEVSFEVVDT
jgi:hypothetical protein